MINSNTLMAVFDLLPLFLRVLSLAEASRKNTVSGIKNTLAKYNLTTAVAEDFKSLVDDIKSAPVDIFEAKPERVVGFDEVKYAIVPNDVSADVKNALEDIGIETKTYESGNETDRLNVLNTLTDVRFSRELDINGNEYVKVDDNTIDAEKPVDIVKVLKQIAKSKNFYDMEINGQHIGLNNERGIKEWIFSKDAQRLYKNDKKAYHDKIQSFQNADELLKTAKSYVNEEAIHKKKFENFARGSVRFKVNDNGYVADVLVGIRPDQSAELYDIINLAPTKITEKSQQYLADNAAQLRQDFSVDNSLSQNSKNVNTASENVTQMQHF